MQEVWTMLLAVLLFALVLTFIQVKYLGSGDFMKGGE